MKWKLFCTVTMKSYEVEASSEYEARKQLANQLNVPLSCIDVYRQNNDSDEAWELYSRYGAQQ